MATPITVHIPHELGRVEAKRRIESGFGKLFRQLPGIGGACTEHWDGDRLNFSVLAVGQTISGVVTVLDAVVTMEIELPGFLGRIAAAFRGQLERAGQLLLTNK